MMIVDLKDHKKYLPILATWHHQQWSCLNPGDTIEDRMKRMNSYLGDDLIPSMYIWLDNNEVRGSAAIKICDMDTRPQLSPWLASVYVDENRRCSGIGSALVKHVMDVARDQGHSELFLFTPDKENFYAALGWQTLAQEMYRGERVSVMHAVLS